MHRHLLVLMVFALANLAQAKVPGVSNSTLAVIVNDNDPQSVEVASYYQAVRQIPEENIVHLRFDPGKSALTEKQFGEIARQVRQQVPDSVQAYALTWTRPYKVACMSITSAFALGFDRSYCAKGCNTTRSVPYYNSEGGQPYRDFGIRPTMMLAGRNAAEVRALVDRGVAADSTRPGGRAYLVSTSDRNRNVRAALFPYIANTMKEVLAIRIVGADYIEDKPDVLFYFTGVKSVARLASNHFLPGAMADHLTSSGGVLFGGRQMSALKWLEAGATGSYGTVVEPCSFPGKFPNPAVAMLNYLDGDTLLEAYWKSVAMPGQGLFIGEPLASPYRGCRLRVTPTGSVEFENAVAASGASAPPSRCRTDTGSGP